MIIISRYCTVCLSYRSNKVQHLFYTVPILFFSLVFNVPRFFELTTEVAPANVTVWEEVNYTDPDTGDITFFEGRREYTDT